MEELAVSKARLEADNGRASTLIQQLLQKVAAVEKERDSAREELRVAREEQERMRASLNEVEQRARELAESHRDVCEEVFRAQQVIAELESVRDAAWTSKAATGSSGEGGGEGGSTDSLDIEQLRAENRRLEQLRQASNVTSHRLAEEKRQLEDQLAELQAQHYGQDTDVAQDEPDWFAAKPSFGSSREEHVERAVQPMSAARKNLEEVLRQAHLESKRPTLTAPLRGIAAIAHNRQTWMPIDKRGGGFLPRGPPPVKGEPAGTASARKRAQLRAEAAQKAKAKRDSTWWVKAGSTSPSGR